MIDIPVLDDDDEAHWLHYTTVQLARRTHTHTTHNACCSQNVFSLSRLLGLSFESYMS